VLDTSVNHDKKLTNWVTSVVIDAHKYFPKINEVKEEVDDVLIAKKKTSEQLEKSAQLFCLFYDYATMLHEQFETQYHQEIQKSVFRKAISGTFETHFFAALMYLTDYYRENPELYNEALLKQRFWFFKIDVESILQKNFSWYRYSKFKLEHLYNGIAFKLITWKK